ncbi:hypothetical protein [Picosynechococcus sp. PCC 8807]|uniref:hypothetical protein n=1 Tax=Picosynechococcus sp. PCC 8807 TaxID=195248 RepID=UPI0012EDD138|nr:hypothetical protein [Picosynechococcus sp. PCC 8807]
MNTIEMLLAIVRGYEEILGVEGPSDLPLESRLRALLMTLTHCTRRAENLSEHLQPKQVWADAIAIERARLNR